MTAEEVFSRWDAAACASGRPKTETYAFLAPSYVLEETRAAAAKAVWLACDELGIEEPAIYWFTAEGAAERAYRLKYGGPEWPSFRAATPTWGVSSLGAYAIGVLADLQPTDAAETAAHEIRHLLQAPERDYWTDAEPEAHEYGRAIRDKLASSRDLPRGDGRRVHTWEGFPYNFYTLAGVAEPDDLLRAHDADGNPALYKNIGSKSMPRWLETQ